LGFILDDLKSSGTKMCAHQQRRICPDRLQVSLRPAFLQNARLYNHLQPP
jgi:hypothetical protein